MFISMFISFIGTITFEGIDVKQFSRINIEHD